MMRLGLFLVFWLSNFGAAAATSAQYEKEIIPMLEYYCYDCHGDGASKGGFSLEDFKDLSVHLDDVDHWETVWRNVQSQIMPPNDEEQFTIEEKNKLMAWVERRVFKLDPANPDPGAVTIRRLNRNEYRYAVEDLLGVKVDTREIFPADDTGHGFDTIGSVLSISPLLMEKYVEVAENVMEQVLPEGGAETEGFKRIFKRGKAIDDKAARAVYAREILGDFATSAYRRPVDAATLDRLVALTEAVDAQENRLFTDGIRMSMTAILASPRFLFRAEVQAEPDNPAKIVDIDEFALASRLSFFLWSSVPDGELLRLAGEKKLRQELRPQVERMLGDWKAGRFVENFVGQWLQVRDVTEMQINPKVILELSNDEEANRIFNGGTRWAMKEETERFFKYVLLENRPVEELISADYSFLNETLAKFYGVEGVNGNDFRKVEFGAKNQERGGILSQGSFLTVTSNPTRTSPVKRGLFVLENILGTPAPPAPPGVPPLEDSGKKDGKKLTMRETMEIHRAKSECRGCHARMDPIGLGLENFNALGQFRKTEHGSQIDSAGKLVTGEDFSNVIELKKIIAEKRKGDFYRCLSEKLLTYAIGRGVDYYDSVTIHRLVDDLQKNGGGLKDLVIGVIESAPFQKRRGDG